MKRTIFTTILTIGLCVCTMAQKVSFNGSSHAIYEETPNSSTGLHKIFVIYNTSGVAMSYEAKSTNSSVTWYKYGTQGGGYASKISDITRNGNTYTLNQVIPNSGYIIEENDSRTYLWVVNYADYNLSITSIEPAEVQDCGSIALNVTGHGDDIIYTTINGISKTLSRNLTLSYNTLEWNNDNSTWNPITTTKTLEGFKSSIHEQAPLCNTDFTLSGDRFLDFWDEKIAISSSEYTANSVEIQTTAKQSERDSPNEKKDNDESSLGGSAPVDITFSAYPTDAAATREWQLSSDPEFNTIERNFSEDIYQETFNDAGTFYIRYVAKNSTETCEAISDTYTVSIGESNLICPNAFSPEGSPGINDEWRVQYKSITSFKCWIFNRWGTQLCELNDPSQGWDGKYKGKYVGSGVYYYVIQAKGADGKEYKLKGDINIINYKEDTNTNSDSNNEGAIE